MNGDLDNYGPEPLCKLKSLGEKMKFEPAHDPSDIIWENMGTTKAQLRWGKCGVCLAITIFLIVSSGLFYKMKTSFNENIEKYPNNIYCSVNIDPLIKMK